MRNGIQLNAVLRFHYISNVMPMEPYFGVLYRKIKVTTTPFKYVAKLSVQGTFIYQMDDMNHNNPIHVIHHNQGNKVMATRYKYTSAELGIQGTFIYFS